MVHVPAVIASIGVLGRGLPRLTAASASHNLFTHRTEWFYSCPVSGLRKSVFQTWPTLVSVPILGTGVNGLPSLFLALFRVVSQWMFRSLGLAGARRRFWACSSTFARPTHTPTRPPSMHPPRLVAGSMGVTGGTVCPRAASSWSTGLTTTLPHTTFLFCYRGLVKRYVSLKTWLIACGWSRCCRFQNQSPPTKQPCRFCCRFLPIVS